MPKQFTLCLLSIISVCVISCKPLEQETSSTHLRNFSGVYPHLAFYNDEGECGTGAVVPWADRLWVITYGPHLPFGSSDKLYEVTPELELITRKESIGGTAANRMIHRESNQLFIGPYAIDTSRNVRTISYDTAPGRYTGLARHLTEPSEKLYIATMEEGFYELDVQSLEAKTLFQDGNVKRGEGDAATTDVAGALLPGAHGKGLYSGQGVMVYSNNGEHSPLARKQFDIESGVLAEWDGEHWTVVRRNQFVEVTGPGDIHGNANPTTDPIWATGWDHKSLLLGVRDNGGWSFYRLPKASHSYDGAHGWNTEWPRIRDVGTLEKPDYLMTMHGMFWNFPQAFSSQDSAGIRPRSAYLKVIGDFTRWNDQIVFGGDDSAQREFLNSRKVKGNIGGPGQSNSNLWFTSPSLPDELGPNTAGGAVWLREEITADTPSEPFLFSGWPRRVAWIHNHGQQNVEFSFEIDKPGDGTWTPLRSVSLAGGEAAMIDFADDAGEWIRARADRATNATVHFSFSADDNRAETPDKIFSGLAAVTDAEVNGGLLYGLGDDRRALGVVAMNFEGAEARQVGYYELDAAMNLSAKEDTATLQYITNKFAVPQHVVAVDESSVLIRDDQGRRWRLPLGNTAFSGLTDGGALRIAREVATERDLFSSHGTFYELPAENADGFAKIRPIASHDFRIHDYASYRGLLVMTGIDLDRASRHSNIVVSDDGKAAVWAGVIDDLWKLGKPRGHGGPWNDAAVNAGEPSDPYLIGFYDQRTLTLSHDADGPVTFTIETDPIGHGPWMKYKALTVQRGETVTYEFPEEFQSRWIRFRADQSTTATAWLEYE